MSVTLDDLQGRVMDVDSHEMVPTGRYGEAFGDRGVKFLESSPVMRLLESMASDSEAAEFAAVAPDLNLQDDAEITPESVWTVKGYRAPSAFDMSRRPAVLDEMGIQRALIFPTMGLFAFSEASGGGFNGTPFASEEQMETGRAALNAYNEWAGRYTQSYPGRLRIVGVLASGKPNLTPENLVTETQALIATGVKAVMIASGAPPAGVSPADPALDPFYAALAEADVALVFHPPSGAGYRKTDVWGRASGLTGDLSFPVAIAAAEENFICVMILGGVFERHPTLRVGVVETGASWVGPLAEKLDSGFGTKSAPLPLKPSEYLSRNVRASVLLDEPVEVWLERYPMVQSVYCYSSDFPHPEGREWSLKEFYGRVAPLGDDVVEKFFVTNSQLLLP